MVLLIITYFIMYLYCLGRVGYEWRLADSAGPLDGGAPLAAQQRPRGGGRGRALLELHVELELGLAGLGV